MKKRQYTAEFKQDAARMIVLDGVPVKELSERLNVPAGQLYRWKSEHVEELEAHNPSSAPSPKQMAIEIADLRKQLAKSQRMNEILKKTVGFFSQD